MATSFPAICSMHGPASRCDSIPPFGFGIARKARETAGNFPSEHRHHAESPKRPLHFGYDVTMIRNFALAMALLWPTVAAANRIEEFLGWSADGTAYGYVDQIGRAHV